MLVFIDEKGKHHSALAEIKETKGVNGEKSISGTIFTNESILEGIGRGWRARFNGENYCLTYAYPIDEGQRIEVEFDAVHEFFFDMKKSVVQDQLKDGSHTMKEYLDFIFNGSGYSYRLEVTVSAFEKQSFGLKNRLTLFNDIIKSVGLEFSVNGTIVRIIKEVGTDLSTIVKKGFNLNELKIEKDIGSFVTAKRGYGKYFDEDDPSKGRLTAEYISPLASIYGRLEDDPVIDERYTVAENLIARLKQEVDSSYSISVSLDMEDLVSAGYSYDRPHEGDYIMAINDDLQFRQKIRILSYTTQYDTAGEIINHEVTAGSNSLATRAGSNEKDRLNQIEAGLEKANENANLAWISADGKNTVYHGPDEPKGKLSKGDIWYQIIGENTVMKFWNGYEWELFFDPDANEKKVQEAKEKAETAAEEAAIAKETADSAVDEASEAHNEAIEAAAEAQAATNRVNSVEAIANDAKTTAGTAISNAADAVNQAKEALDAYNNLEIGDRNLILGSRTWMGHNTTAVLLDETLSGGQVLKYKIPDTLSFFDPFIVTTAIEAIGDCYTVSFYAKADEEGEPIICYFYEPNTTTDMINSQGNVGQKIDGASVFHLSTRWEKYWVKWKQSETTRKKRVIIGRSLRDLSGFKGGYISLAAPMFVEGNQPLDWKVAPEDVQIQITDIGNELSTKVSQSSFNQLQGTVTQQATQITQNKNDILLKANQTDVNTLTGRVSVTESSISTQAGQITAMSSKVENNTAQISTLRQDFSGLSSTVSKVETDLNELNIGSRNLLAGTKDFTQGRTSYSVVEGDFQRNAVLKGKSPTDKAYIDMYQLKTTITTVDEYCTVSFYARGDRENQTFICHYFSPNTTVTSENSQGKIVSSSDGISTLVLTKEWKRYWIRWKQKVATGPKYVLLGRTYEKESYAYISSPMFVEGDRAVVWSPAPEDNVNVLEFSNLTQTVSAIQTTVAGKAEQSQVTQMANQITSVVANVGNLANLNLLPNTDYQVDPFISDASGWGASTGLTCEYSTHTYYNAGKSRLLKIVSKSAGELFVYSKINDNVNDSGRIAVRRNTKYTVQISGFNDSNVRSIDLFWLGRTKGNATQYDVVNPFATNFQFGTSGVVKKTFIFDTGETDEGYIRIDHNGVLDSSKNGAIYITEMKLEQGTSATPWNSGAASFTQISQLTTQITSVVTDVEGHTSQISQMSNQITSVVGDVTTIKNSAQDIIPYFERGAIDGDTGVEVNSTWVRSPFVRIKPSTTYIFFNGTTGEAVTTTCYWYWYDSNYNFISRNVVSNPNTATAPATASFLRVCFNDQTDPETIQRNVIAGTQPIKMTPVNKSQITQLQSAINLRVQSGKVISQINVSPESILISGKKIQITGDTYISNGVISTAHIANAAITDAKIGSLSASKVTTGTLNAANVNIINLNVDKLVGNLSQFVRSYWNSINSSVQITGYGMEFYSGSTLEGRLTSSGMEFWYGTRKIGHMGENSKTGYPNIRGIAMDLERTGDYVAWAYRQNASDSYYTTLLTLDPRGSFTGNTGVILGTNMNLKNHNLYEANLVQASTLNCWGGGLSITGLGGGLKLSTTNFNGNSYATIGHTGGNAGVFFGSSYLYLVHGGYVWSWEDYKRLNWFRGKSLAIATSFSSDGTAASWYNVSL